MDFNCALRQFIRSACEFLTANEPLFAGIATQDWFRIVRRDWNSHELIGEKRISSENLAEFLVAGSSLASQIDDIVAAVAADAELATRILIYSDGQPVTDQQFFRHMHVSRVVAGPFLARYLTKKGAAEFDSDCYETTFEEAVDDLSDATTEVRLLLPLANAYLQATEYVIESDIKLRELTNSELEEWFNAPRGIAAPHGDRPVPEKELMRLDCGIEVTYRQSPHEVSLGGAEALAYANKLLTALHLVAEGEIYAPFIQKQYLDRLMPVRAVERAEPMISARQPVGCGPRTARRLRRVWTQMRSAASLSWLDLSLRRWNVTSVRHSDDDKLIDYWVALESMFLREREQSKQNKAAIRIAVCLSNDAAERIAICDAIWESYGCRSALVHADEHELRQYNVHEVVQRTREYLRQALVKAVNTGPFDPTKLADSSLESHVRQRTRAAKQQQKARQGTTP